MTNWIRSSSSALALTLALLANAGTARAQAGAAPAAGDTTAVVKKGVTLGAGKLNLTLTFEPSLSRDSAFKPFSIAPDLAYGVTSRLTLSLVTSGAAVTGFRGAAGNGLCLSGSDGACPHVARNVGAEGMYSLVAGPVAAAAVAGLHVTSITDPTAVKIKVGAKARATSGIFTATFNPSIFVAANERTKSKDALYLPVAASVKVVPALALGLGSGLKIMDLGKAGDTYQIPVGAFAQAQITKQLGAGASFVFGNVKGGSATKDGLDGRFLQIWASYTL